MSCLSEIGTSLADDGYTEVSWITGRQEERRSVLGCEKEGKKGLVQACVARVSASPIHALS